MDYKALVPRWTLALVTLLTWVVGMAVALTPDGLALMEFRNALTVISPLLESWNASDASPCSWNGINCTDSGYVKNITLFAQMPMLEGNISASLGKLKSLEGLVLDQNMLSGSIPPELGNLGSLRTLSLSFNRFTGGIPPELGNCSSLVELVLASNLFSGNIPEVIYKNLNFTYYDVSGNNFSGDITTVLDDFSRMPTISIISMEKNSFTGTLPPSIGNATTLIYLSLGVSPDLGQTGGFGGQIPKELGKLVNLTTLDLGNLNFTGEIPPWLGNMMSMKILILRSNELNGTIPLSLSKLVNLTWLELSNNSIIGPIPASFTSLINMKNIALSYNGLTGQIPTNLSKTATSLEGVYLQNNSLSGPIPHDFGRFMPNLTYLSISNNFFNGTLPDGLCKGDSLQWLSASNNNLQGVIPLSLVNCTSLVMVALQDNQFTSIPNGFGSNSLLQQLRVARNQLTGQLPIGLGANSHLVYLDLSENRFTGDISVLEFSLLAQNLSILNLAKNNFSGEIPITMVVCKLLFHVDLSYNSLTGIVPLALTNLSSLQKLHLQSNKLTLLHPRIYLGFATTLRDLNLAKNPWNTSIATEIGSLRVLQILNLSYGGYTGPIPLALGKLTQLEVLDLSHNNLTGEVPNELGELMISLTSVNISFNGLTGALPPAWVKFFIANPNSFVGNPGLCLWYNANNVCIGGSNHNITNSRGKSRKITFSVGLIASVVFGVALAFAVFVAFLLCWRRSTKIKGKSPPIPQIDRVIKNLTTAPLPFTFDDIMDATENLSNAYIIGRGCHGVVYKAILAKGTHIVVKKIESLDMKTTLVHKSFWKEIESIGNAKHQNLVRLLGFMKWGEVGFLLYDYVSNGDLHAALHDMERSLVLDWKKRLQIAQDVAHGLAYLHHTYNPPIVHRDITSSNVLLDNNLEAQISDFGLSKVLDMQPRSQQWSSTSPAVLGTYGYIAPEVGYSTVVTTKLDVYSYGVLLLELLTGKKPANDPSFNESLHVVAWVKEKVQQNDGKMSEFVLDPSVLDVTNMATRDEMLAVQMIALLCTKDNPTDRPTMKEIVEMFSSILPRNKNRNGNENEISNI